ncbi:MFS transporter, partial [Weissella soli]
MDEKVSTKTALSILAVALVSFSGIMSETSMNVTFPVLSKLFNTSLNTIQWVTTAYLLSVTVMVTTSAYLTKRFSVRTLWLTGVIIFTAGTLVGGLANNVPVLLLGRIMQGVAAGIAMPLMFNIIIANIPQSRIGTWMGIGSLVVSLAPSFGPTYGGAL